MPHNVYFYSYIWAPNTGQMNRLLHTIAEFRPIVNRIVARQSTDSLAANAQFSPDESKNTLIVLTLLATVTTNNIHNYFTI